MEKGRKSLRDSQAPSPEGSDDELRSPVEGGEEAKSPVENVIRGRQRAGAQFLKDELRRDPFDVVH